MRLVGLQPLLMGDIVAQREALQDVAIVEEQAVFRLGLRRLDQTCGLGEADRVVGAVAKIVVSHDIDVEIGRLQHSQLEAHRRLRREPRVAATQ